MSSGIKRTTTRSNLYESGAGRMLPAYRQGGPATIALQVKMDGVDGTAAFIDSSPNKVILAPFLSATLSSTQAKFGPTSGAFSIASAQGGYIEAAYNSRLDVTGSDTFSTGMWIYPTAAQSSGARLFSFGGGSVAFNSTNGIHFFLQRLSGGAIQIQYWTGSTAAGFDTGTRVANLNQWSYVTLSRAGSTFSIGVNGVVTTASATFGRPSSNPRAVIGGIFGDNGSSSNCWRGYIDDLWFVKGSAIANHAVPSRPFPYS